MTIEKIKNENVVDIDLILDQALDRCLSGEPIDDVIKDYDSDTAEQLKPLLEGACTFHNVESPRPNGEALTTALSVLEESKESNGKKIIFPRFIYKMVASFVVVLSLFWSLNLAAKNTVPGDPLYFIKRLSEKIEYMITPTADGKVELRLTFSQKRMKELLKKTKTGELTDLELVYEMLDEVRYSLEHISGLSPEKKEALLNRSRSITKKHAEVIKEIAENSPAPLKDELLKAEKICCCRDKWFSSLEGKSIFTKSTCSCAPGACSCTPGTCSCAPSDKELMTKLKSFPK